MTDDLSRFTPYKLLKMQGIGFNQVPYGLCVFSVKIPLFSACEMQNYREEFPILGCRLFFCKLNMIQIEDKIIARLKKAHLTSISSSSKISGGSPFSAMYASRSNSGGGQ